MNMQPELIAQTSAGIVYAVSHRTGLTQGETRARADGVMARIQAFRPSDMMQVILTGQVIGLHEIFADATHDVLNGMNDLLKLKTQSNLVNIARLTQGHMDRLQKMGNRPAQTETRPAVAAEPAARKPAAKPAAPIDPAPPASESPENPVLGGYKRPTLPDSWLDEPVTQWLVETPAEEVARLAQEGPDTPPEPDPEPAPEPVETAARPVSPPGARPDIPPADEDFAEPALPRRRSGYAAAEPLALTAAAPGD